MINKRHQRWHHVDTVHWLVIILVSSDPIRPGTGGMCKSHYRQVYYQPQGKRFDTRRTTTLFITLYSICTLSFCFLTIRRFYWYVPASLDLNARSEPKYYSVFCFFFCFKHVLSATQKSFLACQVYKLWFLTLTIIFKE